jgi:hypothetical protein
MVVLLSGELLVWVRDLAGGVDATVRACRAAGGVDWGFWGLWAGGWGVGGGGVVGGCVDWFWWDRRAAGLRGGVEGCCGGRWVFGGGA